MGQPQQKKSQKPTEPVYNKKELRGNEDQQEKNKANEGQKDSRNLQTTRPSPSHINAEPSQKENAKTNSKHEQEEIVEAYPSQVSVAPKNKNEADKSMSIDEGTNLSSPLMGPNLEGPVMHVHDSDTEAIQKKVKHPNPYENLQISLRATRECTLEDLLILQKELKKKENEGQNTDAEDLEVIHNVPTKKEGSEDGHLDVFTKVTYKRKKK